MRETKTKQVGDRGVVYHVSQFGAKKGGRVLVRIMKMIGSAAGGALKGDDESAFSLESIGRIVSNFAEQVTEEDFDYLCDEFMACTQVETEPGRVLPLKPLFDMHFAGEYKEMGLWLMFAIEVNYGSFLPEGGLASLRKPAAKEQPQASEAKASPPSALKSPSPSISATTGPSGA